jgi:hypothetical protein
MSVAVFEFHPAADPVSIEKFRARRLGLAVTAGFSTAAWMVVGLGLHLTSII